MRQGGIIFTDASHFWSRHDEWLCEAHDVPARVDIAALPILNGNIRDNEIEAAVRTRIEHSSAF
jgi:hypothetical protein